MPETWLAFELNILRRLEFKSIALPITGNPTIGSYLKKWNVRVLANDVLYSSHLSSLASIENNSFELNEGDASTVLEDAYVPQYEYKNPALVDWFGETDAWWFDNVRANIELLDSTLKKAIAISICLKVGDYALSFDNESRRLRQSFSTVFRKYLSILAKPVDNGQENICQNKSSNEFTAENYTDLLFLRLPPARKLPIRESLGQSAWKEEWVRGNNSFWTALEERLTGRLGAHIETKSQYLSLLADLFKTASHIPKWAIVHSDDSFVPTQDIIETIGGIRRVETIFTKDFSELMGTKAVVVTA